MEVGIEQIAPWGLYLYSRSHRVKGLGKGTVAPITYLGLRYCFRKRARNSFLFCGFRDSSCILTAAEASIFIGPSIAVLLIYLAFSLVPYLSPLYDKISRDRRDSLFAGCGDRKYISGTTLLQPSIES